MYPTNSKENGYARPRSNLGVRNSGSDWRTRTVSSSNHTNSGVEYNGITKRSVSPIPDSLSSASDTGSTRQTGKYSRRPMPNTNSGLGAGQSVAALQQHHQRLMQQQEAAALSSRNGATPNYRSISPIPTNTKSTRAMENSNIKSFKQHQFSATTVNSNNDDDDVVYDDVDEEYEGDDVEEERMVIIQDVRARSPSINRGSGGSVMSVQPAPSFYHTSPSGPQEFKIVKEGWLYRKNGLMQWKAVYAVAKHGNAVKPGGLYLYKDVKCTNHIHTYDMSEVLEVSPRQQDYKQGIKWEIRMLVKRDDVILATDDMLSRKDWVDSLTSIMGKVSIATQNELTSRIHSSEQMNRDLQGVAEELDQENTQLKEQLQALTESAAKKDRFYQQELQNRENELKEAIAKKERHFQQELREREEELNTEMDRQRQALETKCEIFEREAMQWRSKYTELEKSHMASAHADFDGKHQTKIESLEIEIRKWRNRVDELEHHQKQMDYRKSPSHESYKARNIKSSSFENNDTLKETMSDIKFNLQVLRDQIKTSSDGPLLDIKANVNKLCDTLDEAKLSWSELQGDIIKFLETEKEDSDTKESHQKNMIELLRNDFTDLREELVGTTVDDNAMDSKDEKEKKLPSLSEKFDILIQMVENVQIGQSRLTSSFMDSNPISINSTDGSSAAHPVSSADRKESDLYMAVTSQQKQISEWIEESREIQNSTLTTIQSNIQENRSLPSVPSDISLLHEKITNTIEKAMSELSNNQQQGQEEQGKNIKAIGNYLQLISNDIQDSSIPDLSALSQQLEDVVERLSTTEERLSLLNDPTNCFPSSVSNPEDAISFRNIPTSSNMNDEDKLSQLHNFVKNTERFMERSLRILSRYGDNPNGMEETIRRAVKGASKAHLEEIIAIQEQNKDERGTIEKKIQRYEENARTYFDKSMEKMHTDLHEFTGVMYEMLERLVLQALEHSSPETNAAVGCKDGDDQQQKSIQNVIELHGKLSGMNQMLKSEIAKLEEERDELKTSVKELKKTSKDLEHEVDKRHVELRTIRSEYERVNRDIQRSREEKTNKLAKELEPLFHQISQLKRMASVSNFSDDNSDDIMGYADPGRERKTKSSVNQKRSVSPMPTSVNRHSRYDDDEESIHDEVDKEEDRSAGRKLRFPTMLNNRSRRGSFTSQYSDSSDQTFGSNNRQPQYDQQSIKSPLIGSRDRPRGKSPLPGFVGRK